MASPRRDEQASRAGPRPGPGRAVVAPPEGQIGQTGQAQGQLTGQGGLNCAAKDEPERRRRTRTSLTKVADTGTLRPVQGLALLGLI